MCSQQPWYTEITVSLNVIKDNCFEGKFFVFIIHFMVNVKAINSFYRHLNFLYIQLEEINSVLTTESLWHIWKIHVILFYNRSSCSSHMMVVCFLRMMAAVRMTDAVSMVTGSNLVIGACAVRSGGTTSYLSTSVNICQFQKHVMNTL